MKNKPIVIAFVLMLMCAYSLSVSIYADVLVINDYHKAQQVVSSSLAADKNAVTFKIGDKEYSVPSGQIIAKGNSNLIYSSNGIYYEKSLSDRSEPVAKDKTADPLLYNTNYQKAFDSSDILTYTSRDTKQVYVASSAVSGVYEYIDTSGQVSGFWTTAGVVNIDSNNDYVLNSNGNLVNLGKSTEVARKMLSDIDLIKVFLDSGFTSKDITVDSLQKIKTDSGYTSTQTNSIIKYDSANNVAIVKSGSEKDTFVERTNLNSGVVEKIYGEGVTLDTTFNSVTNKQSASQTLLIKGVEKTIATKSNGVSWSLDVSDSGKLTGKYSVTNKDGKQFTFANNQMPIVPADTKLDLSYVIVRDGKPVVNNRALDKFTGDKAAAKQKALDAIEVLNQARDDAKESIHEEIFANARREYEKSKKNLVSTYGIPSSVAGFFLKLNDYSNVAQGFSGFSSLFASNKAIQDWKLAVDKTFKPFTTAGWVEAICAKKFKQPPQATAFVKIPGGSITPAATVAAECTPVLDSLSGNTTRMYKFTIHVSNPQSTVLETPMIFNVRLYGSREVDFFNEKQILQRGESFTLDKDKQPVLSSELYDKICINFDEPPEFFKGSEICNKIVCRDDLAQSGYESLPTSAEIYVTVAQKQAAQGTTVVSAQETVTQLINPSI